MSDFLFVYGSLQSGCDNPHARLLRAGAEFKGAATVSGSVIQVGGYPAFRPEPPGEVQGELYRLTNPSILAALDEYEGDGYERVIVRAGAVDAWIYKFKEHNE